MAKREVKLLVADDDPAELQFLRAELYNISNGKVFTAADGIQTINTLIAQSPDILLLDMVMPGMDGLSVIRRISEINLTRIPHVAAMIEPGQETLGQLALNMGVGTVLDKSALPYCLPNIINQTLSSSRRKLMGGAEVEKRIYSALIELGIARHLDGFNYLMEAIMLVLEDADYQINFSKCLYPAIAERYNTSATCVERCIRHAVESAWSRIKISILQREFGNTIDSDRGKPTNSEFIARMADKVRHGGTYLPGGE